MQAASGVAGRANVGCSAVHLVLISGVSSTSLLSLGLQHNAAHAALAGVGLPAAVHVVDQSPTIYRFVSLPLAINESDGNAVSSLFLCRKLHLFLRKSTKTAAIRAALF